jgi:hypothetical protein
MNYSNDSLGRSQPEMQDETRRQDNDAGSEQQPGQYPSGGNPANAAHGAPQPDYLPWPPGFAGRLANFIYHNSYLAIPEVAISATLGLMAGVCGRAFETPTGKDLSLYIILVARSGIGKDGIHDGIPKLIDLAATPGAEYFIRSQDFASGPALHKALLMQPGFLNLQGEFGRKLKGMSNLSNAPMQELRTVMTNAYAKDFLEGKAYSSSEKSLPGVRWPALSFLGETTPGTFSESQTPDMMEDGFMSRFFIITYDGPRPSPNEARGHYEFEPQELAQWKGIVARALPYQGTINTPNRNRVDWTNDAYDKLERFEFACTDSINATEDESERQVWNRAHIKAMKIACLLAVADNHVYPKIDLGHATWAITVVRRDIAAFQARKKNGDIGTDDHAREQKLLALARRYIRNGVPDSYKVPKEMQQKGVIPRVYFQRSISKSSAFANHRAGASVALDMTLRSLVDSGYFMEYPKTKLFEEFEYHGKCYMALNLP